MCPRQSRQQQHVSAQLRAHVTIFPQSKNLLSEETTKLSVIHTLLKLNSTYRIIKPKNLQRYPVPVSWHKGSKIARSEQSRRQIPTL